MRPRFAAWVPSCAEFVVTTVQVQDDARPVMTTLAVRSRFNPRIGHNRAFNRPWSASTRLFAYRAVLCNAAGAYSATAFANAAA
jgi:hypothetical protein